MRPFFFRELSVSISAPQRVPKEPDTSRWVVCGGHRSRQETLPLGAHWGEPVGHLAREPHI